MKRAFLGALIAAGTPAMANNLSLSGVTLTAQNAASNTHQVAFNIAWENSWRTAANESNWDGAWVFVKYRKVNTSLWQHATLSYNAGGAAAAGHVQPAGAAVVTTPDGKGALIHRAAAGSGAVNYTGAQLSWHYGADSLQDADSVEVRVFAVEMVYCTGGQFYLGTDGAETGHFRAGGSTNAPYLVAGEGAVPVTNASGSLFYASGAGLGDAAGPIPAAFPKGHAAFWLMKYECSQQQYADFLNTLDAASANTRNGGIPGTVGNYVAAVPGRAYGAVGGDDHLAYLDWAALRPMTELEYEKASRGYNNYPIANEFAWGNTTILGTASFANTGSDSERNATVANANYANNGSNIGRTTRVGCFAHDTTTSRTQSGGTYYGAMDMSGNLTELCVTAGSATGRAYTGTHGDGRLGSAADANEANWVNGMLGNRGGAWAYSENGLRTSERSEATPGGASRTGYNGIRGVRTAP